jgi:tRNA(adenine34) deaminase
MKSPMQHALMLAKQAAEKGEVPVGAVIVLNGNILAAAHNLTETLNDVTAHAEMLCIREAATILGEPRLPECELYVTLEPCPMCATAISFARIKKLVFGAYDVKSGGVEHGHKIFAHPTCHHTPEIIGGVDETASSALLKAFFGARR